MTSLPHNKEPLRVELGARSYRIHIGPGLLERAGQLLSGLRARGRGFVVTHPGIDRLHGDSLRRGLAGMRCETLLVPAGERQKCLRRAGRLYDALLASGADRQSVIVAFGGGVIGDLAGFVAATYMRGVAYVQIPTTLLAQVDSSVGGKVAVDHPHAKNLIGAFYQPLLVIADTDVLRTLSRRDYRAGLAEVVKHGVIADAALFGWLEANAAALARRDGSALAHVVRRNCEIKAEIVRQDERESGLRAILNLGHTVGHAAEALAGYGAVRHGEAVSMGMVAAARLASDMSLFPEAECRRVEDLLAVLGLPTRLPALRVDDVLAALKADKKAVSGVPRFVLPRAIGAAEIFTEVPADALRRILVALGASES